MGWKRLGVQQENHESKPGAGQELVVMHARVAHWLEQVEQESMQDQEEKDWQWKTQWNC